jgi:colicin import membrane protein
MKSLFQLQTESGQLWLDIQAQLQAKDTEHAAALAAKDAEKAAAADAHAAALAAKDAALTAAVEAEGRAVHARLDALVQAGQEAHAAGDLDALGAVLAAAYSYTSGARRAKLETDLAAAQVAAADVAAKLAAL